MQLLTQSSIQKLSKCIPSRLQMFLFGFYIWTWILFQLTKVANIMLGLIIMYLPYYLIPNVTPKTPVKIIKAIDDQGNEITKQLKLFMNFKWDKTMCDEGGIDLDIFAKYIKSSVIWIAYILEYEVGGELYNGFTYAVELLDAIPVNDFLSDSNSDKETIENETIKNETKNKQNNKVSSDFLNCLKKCIRLMIVNTDEKKIFKLNKDTTELIPEDIVFGEVNFFG